MKTEELDRLCEEPNQGEMCLQFVRNFCRYSIFDGKIDSVLTKGTFVCCYDDNNVKAYQLKKKRKGSNQ